jgi:hypothetical protein
VSAANVPCEETDIFNKDKITRIDISTLLILTLVRLGLMFTELLLVLEVVLVMVVVVVAASEMYS